MEARLYDVIVVGGGPAGLTAALYLARAGYRVLVMEKEQFGGQIVITDEVVNYPGVGKISGAALAGAMQRQAENFGAELLMTEVRALLLEGDIKTVCTSRGDYRCFGVLLATGAHPRTVGFKGEIEHKGHGVAYCATCDGEFFTGRDVFVVGGGYAAAEEGVYLTRFARHVTILMRGRNFSCAESVADRARNHSRITVLTSTVVEEVSGENGLTYIRWKNTDTGEVKEFHAAPGETFGVFVFAGYVPETSLVKGVAALDERGCVITDEARRTSVEGLYAAGDVCVKSLRQVVTATGDGALAAASMEKYVEAMHRKTGVRTEAAAPEKREAGAEHLPSGGFFPPETERELRAVFAKMARPLCLRLHLDERSVSGELRRQMEALSALTDRLHVEIAPESGEGAPSVQICTAEGKETGLAFHGVPGGHEFASFVLALYNAAGPGQTLDEALRRRIAALKRPVRMKILVTLSCGMCPSLVTAAQHIAAENDQVRAEVYDIRHFPALQARYKVMSVPCLVIDDTVVSFGQKNMEQVLTLLGV